MRRQYNAHHVCHDEQNIIGHSGANLVEKRTRQIGCAPFSVARVDVKLEKLVPMFVGQISPGNLLDLYAVIDGAGAFLFEVLRLREASAARNASKLSYPSFTQ